MSRNFGSLACVISLFMLAGCGSTLHSTDRTGARISPSPESLARRVADRVLKDFPEPPPFDWGEGVLMAGMMRAGVTFNEPRYIEFVKSWADHWQARGIADLLAEDKEKRLKGYCGQWGPGFALLLLYEHTREPAYLTSARQIADFMLTQATRTDDGGLGHWAGNYQLWVDTLYMHGPLLARLSQYDRRPELLSDVVLQIEVYTERLRDPTTNLYYHMYDAPKNTRSSEFWARGNGWVAMTLVEVLPFLEPGSDEARSIREHLLRLMDALRRTQDPATGRWHTVLDRPDSYLETSASAMILAAFVQGHRAGLLQGDDRALIERAWRGLTTQVDDWGWVFGVSGGTTPGGYANYADKVTGTYTWGTGAFLLAASAMAGPHH